MSCLCQPPALLTWQIWACCGCCIAHTSCSFRRHSMEFTVICLLLQCSEGDGEGHVLLEASSCGSARSSLQSDAEVGASAHASGQARIFSCNGAERASFPYSLSTGQRNSALPSSLSDGSQKIDTAMCGPRMSMPPHERLLRRSGCFCNIVVFLIADHLGTT